MSLSLQLLWWSLVQLQVSGCGLKVSYLESDTRVAPMCWDRVKASKQTEVIDQVMKGSTCMVYACPPRVE